MIKNLKDKIIARVVKMINAQEFLSMQIDITNTCNLKCVHCYRGNQLSFDMNLSDWKNILNQYDELRNRLFLKPKITICGGEPFVSPILPSIIDEIYSRNTDCCITVLTNGTKVHNHDISKWKGKPLKFQVSLDGPDSETHDSIRGKGSFQKTLEGIKKLQHEGFEVRILSVLSQRTSPWIERLFHLAQQLGVPQLGFTRFIAQGRALKLTENAEDGSLSKENLRDSMIRIINASKKFGVYTETSSPLYVLIDPNLGRHGKVGFQGLVVDCNGNLKISSRTDFILGNLRNNTITDLFFHHEVMKSLRRGKIEKCGSCNYYTKCGGNRNAAYAAFGNFLAPDPDCWYSGN